MPATKQRRRSAHLEMVGGKGGRQRLWEAIRKLRTDFNMIDLAAKADTDIDTAKTYLQALEKAGHIEVVQENHGHTDKRWNLLRDNGLEAPRLTRDGKPVIQGLAREAMWRTMRIVRDFTFHELAALASSTEVTVAPTTAKDYLKHLLNAGYAHSLAKRMYRVEKLEWLDIEQLQGVMVALVYDAKRHGRPA